MSDPQPLDPVLAARLRELSEQRVAARVQAAKQQAEQRKQARREFARNRDRGLTERHSIRTQMINRHTKEK